MKGKTRIAVWSAALVVSVAGAALGHAVANASTNISPQTTCMKVSAKHKAYECPATVTGPERWEVNQHPGGLYMGNGHAPYLTGLYWTVDQHSEGKAHGTLHTYRTACLKGPNPSGCKQVRVKVTIVLTVPKWHQVDPLDGGYYWSAMAWRYTGTGLAAPRNWHISKGFWRS